jgi:stage II sporulation SpoAA-like protein
MPIVFSVSANRVFVTVSASGVVDREEVAEFITALANDDALKRGAVALVDVNDATLAFAPTEARLLVQHVATLPERRIMRIAFVARSNGTHATLRKVAQLLESNGIPAQAFMDIGQASAWLEDALG